MSKTLFEWRQDRNGGKNGTLILWPSTERQMQIELSDFKTGYQLGTAITEVTAEAFKNGRASMKAEISRIEP